MEAPLFPPPPSARPNTVYIFLRAVDQSPGCPLRFSGPLPPVIYSRPLLFIVLSCADGPPQAAPSLGPLEGVGVEGLLPLPPQQLPGPRPGPVLAMRGRGPVCALRGKGLTSLAVVLGVSNGFGHVIIRGAW